MNIARSAFLWVYRNKPALWKKVMKFAAPSEQLNINLDLCNSNQKKVLICYFPIANFDFDNVSHSISFHANQMIHYFIQRGFCVDVVKSHKDDISYKKINQKHYDVVIGFGPLYIQYCIEHDVPLRVAFFTENNPVVVNEKYNERIEYFQKRHPNIDFKCSSRRMDFYTEEIFHLSDAAIIMQAGKNVKSFKEIYHDKLWCINSNSLVNPIYTFNESELPEIVKSSLSNYLWFGSRGFIHKGLDILLDAFGKLPYLRLDCYGIFRDEIPLFNKLKSANTANCGLVDVLSQEYINEVIYKHNFALLISCSEGMSTAVATCIMHGIIPIITRDCGFEETDCIIQIDDYSVDSIVEIIKYTQTLSIEQIVSMRSRCHEYAKKQFTLENFDKTFTTNMDQCLTCFNIL